MKGFLLALGVAVSSAGLVVGADAQAKRLGGGGTSGLSRQMPARPAPQQAPAKEQTAAPAAAAAPAAGATAPKRSWMGPIAGLAAGLGLAALLSHLGLGEGFANVLMLLLLAGAAFVVIRLLLRRFAPQPAHGGTSAGGMRFAPAGAGHQGQLPAIEPRLGASSGSAAPIAPVAATAPSLPAGFDAAAFERVAKLVFIRMQAANDAGDLDDLRRFSTPEMFATFRLELQERQGAAQRTDVVQLDAQVLDHAEEDGRQIVSVRFHGLLREQADAPAAPFDEIWHLVKPVSDAGAWAIAGIAQNA
jgi:predicted lipid-binding transport protein (Tim44 family)